MRSLGRVHAVPISATASRAGRVDSSVAAGCCGQGVFSGIGSPGSWGQGRISRPCRIALRSVSGLRPSSSATSRGLKPTASNCCAWAAISCMITMARPGRKQIGESGASPMQAETGCPAASRRNGRIVESGTLNVRWGAARFGKNLVRQTAVRAQCGYDRSGESQRGNWLSEQRLKRHSNIRPTPRAWQTLRLKSSGGNPVWV